MATVHRRSSGSCCYIFNAAERQGKLLFRSSKSLEETQRVALWMDCEVDPQGGDRIQSLCQEGQLERAMDVLLRMDHLGVAASNNVYLSLLKACHDRKSLTHAIRIHEHLAQHRLELTSLLGDYLVITLAKCGALEEALQIFHKLPHRTVFSWTAMISAYTENSRGRDALKLHQHMQDDGVEPNHFTFVSLFKACASIPDLKEGRKLHDDARRKGFSSNAYVANTLVYMYGKCESILEAENVFGEMSEHGVVSWNVMLSAYVEQGQGVKALQLYRQMQQEGTHPDERTFVIALQACGTLAKEEESVSMGERSTKLMSLDIGQSFHIDINRKGFASHIFVGNTLVSVYGKCGNIANAERVFVALSKYVLVSWNAMLSAYVEQGHGEKALQFYRHVQEAGMKPNGRTFVSALQACGILAEKEGGVLIEGESLKVVPLKIGQALQVDIQRNGFASDAYVASTLVVLYGKCGSIKGAENVFSALSQRNHVSWCAMLSAYVDQGHGEKALQLYKQMQDEGVTLDRVSFLIALQACCTLAEKEGAVAVDERSMKVVSLSIGQALHADAKEQSYVLDVFIGSVLVSLYGKCGSIVEAEKVFEGLSQRDVVCWSAMLLAYLEQGQGEKALELYDKLKREQMTMDDIVLVCLLQACSETGSMEIFRQLHFSIVSAGYDHISFLASALIHAYGSFASIADSQAVFDRLLQPDFVSWSACVTSYARDGNHMACLGSLEEMQLAGVNLDEVAFLSLLSACSHAGLVDKGVEFFESMRTDYGITPDLKHYATMVDLLGRAGDFTRLEGMLSKMPMQAGLAIWLCLLGACCTHGNMELGKLAFDHAVHLQPNGATAYVLMSNMYGEAGLQVCTNEVEKCRQREFMEKSCFKAEIEQKEETNRQRGHESPQQSTYMTGNLPYES